MPESEGPERLKEIVAALQRLTAAVDRVVSEYDRIRERSDRVLADYRALREAVGGSGGLDGDEKMEERLGRMAEENKTLRETLSEARVRAERIRSRLSVVEDEV
jgi:hypothetical protein